MMLNDFDHLLDPSVLERGRAYFETGAVSDLAALSRLQWQARISGSEEYSVTIGFSEEGSLTGSSCSCPSGANPCKHIVAALYCLRSRQKGPLSAGVELPGNLPFESLLNRIHAEEFREFIRHFAAKNTDFRTELQLWFASRDPLMDAADRYQDWVASLLSRHQKHGYLEYASCFKAAADLTELLQLGDTFIARGDPASACTLATAVLRQTLRALPEADDSMDNLAAVIDSAIDLLDRVASSAATPKQIQEKLHSLLSSELQNDLYFQYGDFGFHAFKVYQKTALNLLKVDEYLRFSDTLLTTRCDHPASTYGTMLLVNKIVFLEACGRQEEAVALKTAFRDHVPVRKMLVEEAIGKQDYASAKKLIAEGIQLAEGHSRSGIIKDWRKNLLRIAELQNDRDTVRTLASYFAVGQGFFSQNHYQQWKSTYCPAEWEGVINTHIQQTEAKLVGEEKAAGAHSIFSLEDALLSALGSIFIEEKYWGRLLELLQKTGDLDSVLRYHAYLHSLYPEELLHIYLPALEKAAHKTTNRKEYRSLVAKMQRIALDTQGGKEALEPLARKLKEHYRNRPAMVEELNAFLAHVPS